jgi:transposase
MARSLHLEPHLSIDELGTRYRRTPDPVERSHWHFLWLLARGYTAKAIVHITGYSAYWIGQIARRYNAYGSEGVQDQRRLGRTVGRQLGWVYLRRLGARLRVPRPRHVRADPQAEAEFKRRLRPLLREVSKAFPHASVELWAVDEHRIGLKPILRKVWSLDGKRPLPPVQHRYEWRYLVGFVHPASGRTIFHLATSVSVPLFEAELAAFAKAVRASPRKQVVLVLDRSGWHSTQRLRVPDHVHLLFLPPYSPELQPAEHLWPLTNAPLINRHFDSIEQLDEAQVACCATLQRQAERIRSTACFHWWPRRLKKPGEPRSG